MSDTTVTIDGIEYQTAQSLAEILLFEQRLTKSYNDAVLAYAFYTDKVGYESSEEIYRSKVVQLHSALLKQHALIVKTLNNLKEASL